MTPAQFWLALRAAALAAAILAYYAWLVDRIGGLSFIYSLAEPLKRRFPARHVEAACVLGYAGLKQAIFFAVLVVAFLPHGLGTQALVCDPVLALLGVALGVGEMGLSTLLGFAAIVIVDSVRQRSRAAAMFDSRRVGKPAATANWSATARGGWMQYYLRAMEVLPKPIGIGFVLLYVFFEEGIFRSVVLTTVAPLGATPALVSSVLLFMVVQTFHTPGWRTAMFPVIGALVLGVANGALFLSVPRLVPLALAHAAFFFSATWSITRLNTGARIDTFG